LGATLAEPAIRLLIVDDHPVVRDGLRGMFAGEDGFEVVAEAGNGTEAVARAKAFEPDVVLMDLRMPGMDGVAAIRKMGELGLGARVLVLTTYDNDSDVLPAIEAGATGYLLKTHRGTTCCVRCARPRPERPFSPPASPPDCSTKCVSRQIRR
jgi:DNA-binding NarL/FixJ family response regulator